MDNNLLSPNQILDNMQLTLLQMIEYWSVNRGGWKDDVEVEIYKADTYKEQKMSEKDPNFDPIQYLIDNADDLSNKIDLNTYASKTDKDIVDKDGNYYKMDVNNLGMPTGPVNNSISVYNFKLASFVKKAMLKTKIEDWKNIDRFKIQFNIANIEKLIKIGNEKQDPTNPFDADWIFGKQVLEDTKKFLENCLK